MKTNNFNNKDNKFFIYSRISSKDENYNGYSMEDQLKIIREKAKKMWITIVEEFTEYTSAKQPGRYKFNEMIKRLEKWEAQWILTYKLDRLTRNPIDTWTIQYMLQNWNLNIIVTNDKVFYPKDSGLISSL